MSLKTAKRIKIGVAVALVVLAIPAGLWLRVERPWETLTERAHRLCIECGLTPDEVDGLIDEFSRPTLRREQAMELFHATFDEDDPPPKLCEPCANAVLDAADEMRRP